MLLIALFKALRNLLLPGVLKIFLWCMLAYGASFAALIWLMSWVVDRYLVTLTDTQGLVAKFLAGTGGVVMAWFMFPLLYPVLVSFFDEKMAEIVDDADYPHLPKAAQPFWPTLTADILFTLKALALNAICLPLLLIPPVAFVVYYGLNGYLIGTQFFRMAAGRRVSREDAERMHKQNFAPIMMTGVLIIFLATIPFINLAAPILGVAVMLHLFYLQLDARKER